MDSKEEYYEIDLLQLIQILWQRIIIVVLSAVICAAGAFGATYFFITPTYEANALLYVNNSSFSLGSTNFSISNAELSAAQSLVDTYIVILKTRTTLNEVIDTANLPYSYNQLSNMINASAVNSTEVFSIKVTSTDPYEAEKIANTISTVLPQKIADVVEGSDVRVVDYAVVPSARSAPSYTKNTAIGFVLGVFLSCAFIILRFLTDTIVRSEDHLIQAYDIPILASIPNMIDSGKARTYGYYGKAADEQNNIALRK